MIRSGLLKDVYNACMSASFVQASTRQWASWIHWYFLISMNLAWEIDFMGSKVLIHEVIGKNK
jgi:hypothetical protein